jgi:hypothetical protein
LLTLLTSMARGHLVDARLRGGPAGSPPRAAGLVAEALAVAREVGAVGLVLLRADSAYYTAKVIAAARRAGARFSITVPSNPALRTAIAAIAEQEWTAIHYPGAVWDEAAGTLTSRTYGKARAATLRRQIINVPAQLAHRAHGIDLHLPTACAHRVQRGPLRPVTIRVWMKDRLDLRFQIHSGYRLRDPIRDSGHTQDPNLVLLTRLGNLHGLHRWREVTSRRHAIPNPIQMLIAILFELLDRHIIHPSRALVS